jgi:predicted ABC-type exoprotein transport system permease subunit
MFDRMNGGGIGMHKQYKIIIIVELIAVLIIMALFFHVGQSLLGITAGLTLFVILLLVNPMVLKTMNRNAEQESVESRAMTDSRICEKMTSFIGVPFILVFGGLWGKYESIFSIDYDGGSVIVLYPGVCLVSKNDELKIVGKWYSGKNVGIEGNFVTASRVENLSSNLVFDTGK